MQRLLKQNFECTFSAWCLYSARLQFYPPRDLFDIIILSVGGNDLYFFKKSTTTSASQVSREVTDHANLLCHRAIVVWVLDIPERNENKVFSNWVNDFLQSVDERKTKDQSLLTWNFNTNDATHLNIDDLKNLRTINKGFSFSKIMKKELSRRGDDEFFERKSDECQCPHSDRWELTPQPLNVRIFNFCFHLNVTLRFRSVSSKMKFCFFVCLSSKMLPWGSTSYLRSLLQ